MSNRIVLGSGKLYCVEFTGTVPTDASFEASANLLGLISGGATLTYKPEFYTAEDDLGLAKKKMITKEEAVLKSGVMTWDGTTLKKLCNTATVTDTPATTTAPAVRTVKIGGIDNFDGKKYALRFLHEDAEGDIRVTVVGTNEAGFEVKFAKDKETVIDAEFKALPMDDDGTLIEYREEYGSPVVTGVVTP